MRVEQTIRAPHEAWLSNGKCPGQAKSTETESRHALLGSSAREKWGLTGGGWGGVGEGDKDVRTLDCGEEPPLCEYSKNH